MRRATSWGSRKTISRAPTRRVTSPVATSLTWTTMGPVNVADDSGAAASGECGMAARAGMVGSKPSVAALTEVCFRNERRVSLVTVLSFPCDVVRGALHPTADEYL